MASMTQMWPWRLSAGWAAAATVGWLAVSLSGGDFRGILVASPLGIGLMVFFLVGGVTLLVRKEEDPGRALAQEKIRRRAPLLALVPAAGVAVTVFAARRAVAAVWGMDEDAAGSAIDAAARAGISYVILVGTALAALHDARKERRKG